MSNRALRPDSAAEFSPLRRTLTLAVLALQLGAIALVIYLFEIEKGLGLLRLLPLVVGGFVIHALLPRPWRLPFFLFLSIAALFQLLGPLHGTILVGLGLALIGLAHLPLPFGWRVVLILLLASGLAAVRARFVESSWAGTVLPVLGGMFMFRLIVYLYDLRHEKQPASIWTRLSYFFLLPAACFPLFPVIDYRVFTRTYYAREERAIYQKGLEWMLLGVVHLVLFRVVYLHLTPAPSEFHGALGFSRFAVTAYLQYLRISGQFHLIVGILCLFGFDLPASNRWYFFASGLSDLWRRLNIYWKEFAQKIIYFPAFLRARRRWSPATAAVVATPLVFVVSWLLHSYQWFWLRGTFPLNTVDALFWGTIGLLVTAGALREATRGRRTPTADAGIFLPALSRSARILGTFCLMAGLWSLWSSESLDQWLVAVGTVRESSLRELLVLAAWLLGALVAGTGLALAARTIAARTWRPGLPSRALLSAAAALLLAVAGLMAGPLPDTVPWKGALVSLTRERLNEQDSEKRTVGYYEGLLDREKPRDSPFLPTAAPSVAAPEDWQKLGELKLVRSVPDLRAYVLRGSQSLMFKGARFSINEYGMRDGSYAREKPAGTYRIALLGASPEMGSGVADGETYEALFEERLNREKAGDRYAAFELLNFAVGGYGLVQQVGVTEESALDFEPDALFLMVHVGADSDVTMRMVRKLLDRDIPLPVGLDAIVAEAGCRRGMSRPEIKQRLFPYFDRINLWAYGEIVRRCRERGIKPVWVFVPLPTELEDESLRFKLKLDDLKEWANQSGFERLSLENAYAGVDEAQLALGEWDHHPNVEGHRLLAEELWREIEKRPDLIGEGEQGER